MRTLLYLPLIFITLIGAGQNSRVRVPGQTSQLKSGDIADWGHCYLSIDDGTEWHSVRTCPNLLQSEMRSIRYIPHNDAATLTNGNTPNRHCQVCRQKLIDALAAGDFRSEADRARVTAMAISENAPPQPAVAPAIEPEPTEQEVITLAEPKVDDPLVPVDPVSPQPSVDTINAGQVEAGEEEIIRPARRILRPKINRYNTYTKYKQPANLRMSLAAYTNRCRYRR